ncbi:hypothetical protein ACVP84_003509 [Escherichia coli]|uniref:hypothetical protein n=1 Tax=Escherichia coli TaxID=562 RepID=UPI00201A67E0|nr:hypothetical protein [Escherichia coli]
MANAPAKSRNTRGELSSQADTEYGFNPARKSADGCKEHLNLYNIDMELKREFPFYYCGQRYETWGTVRGVPVILEKHPLKRKTEKCMEY